MPGPLLLIWGGGAPGAATKMPGAAASYLERGKHLGLLPRCLGLLLAIWGVRHLGLLPRCLGLLLAATKMRGAAASYSKYFAVIIKAIRVSLG